MYKTAFNKYKHSLEYKDVVAYKKSVAVAIRTFTKKTEKISKNLLKQ